MWLWDGYEPVGRASSLDSDAHSGVTASWETREEPRASFARVMVVSVGVLSVVIGLKHLVRFKWLRVM